MGDLETKAESSSTTVAAIARQETGFDVFERVAKLVALVAIPIVIPIALAIYSARVQESTQTETINRDYVQLAVSVLKEKKEDVDSGIRDWAVDLLAEHSPTKFKPEVIEALKSGSVSLPSAMHHNGQGAVVSPDRKLLIKWDYAGIQGLQTGSAQEVFWIPTKNPVTDINFSQDGSQFVSGSEDGTVIVFNTATRNRIATYKAGGEIVDVKFDGPAKIVVSGVGGKQVFQLSYSK